MYTQFAAFWYFSCSLSTISGKVHFWRYHQNHDISETDQTDQTEHVVKFPRICNIALCVLFPPWSFYDLTLRTLGAPTWPRRGKNADFTIFRFFVSIIRSSKSRWPKILPSHMFSVAWALKSGKNFGMEVDCWRCGMGVVFSVLEGTFTPSFAQTLANIRMNLWINAFRSEIS